MLDVRVDSWSGRWVVAWALWSVSAQGAILLHPKFVRPVIPRNPSSTLNCWIAIDTVTAEGRKGHLSFRTKLRSPEECRTLAAMHKPNFEPGRISAKQVTYRWMPGGALTRR